MMNNTLNENKLNMELNEKMLSQVSGGRRDYVVIGSFRYTHPVNLSDVVFNKKYYFVKRYGDCSDDLVIGVIQSRDGDEYKWYNIVLLCSENWLGHRVQDYEIFEKVEPFVHK